MFKTIYHRIRAQKKLQECYKMLEEGARLQLQEGQLNCGVELALMLVEVMLNLVTFPPCAWASCHFVHALGMQAYVRDNASCSRDNMQRVLYIIDAFPRPQTDADGQNDAVEQCTKVTLTAIKWAKRYASTHGVQVPKLPKAIRLLPL